MRKGIVAVETALCMSLIWLPMIALALLIVWGGATQLRLVDATATVGIMIVQGESDSVALNAGNEVADSVGGVVSIDTANNLIVGQRTIEVFGKLIPITATRSIVRP